MFGRLDRYVTRTVLGSYGAGLLFMAVLFTLIQLLVDLGEFLDAADRRDAGVVELFGDMAVYYLLFMPVVFVTVGPFVSVIAGMFAVARHMAVNEVAPMLFTGRSMPRVLLPVLSMGAASAVAMAVVWEFVVPRVAEPLHEARRVLEADDAALALEGLVVKLRDGVDQTLFVDRYDHAERRMEGLSVVDRGGELPDVAVTTAAAATWDAAVGDWRLVDGERQTPVRSAIRASALELLGLPDVEPELLWRLGKEGRETIQLSYSELLDLQSLRPGRNDLVLAFHGHITFPLANLVLLLLALPFAVHFERGSRIERVVFAVLLCGAYLVADLTCQSLGKSLLHPVLAAWLPTIVFGSFGVVFFGSIRT